LKSSLHWLREGGLKEIERDLTIKGEKMCANGKREGISYFPRNCGKENSYFFRKESVDPVYLADEGRKRRSHSLFKGFPPL